LIRRWLKVSNNKRLEKLSFYTVLVADNNNVAYENDKIKQFN